MSFSLAFEGTVHISRTFREDNESLTSKILQQKFECPANFILIFPTIFSKCSPKFKQIMSYNVYNILYLPKITVASETLNACTGISLLSIATEWTNPHCFKNCLKKLDDSWRMYQISFHFPLHHCQTYN